MSRDQRTLTPSAPRQRALPPRPAQVHRNRALVVLALVVALLTGLASAHRTHRRAFIGSLRRHVAQCEAAGTVRATDWPRLPTEQRRAVCAALLDAPALIWRESLQRQAVVDAVVWVLQSDQATPRRARAARALGEMAWHSVPSEPVADGPVDPSVAQSLSRLAALLADHADRDPDPAVRLAAAAALVRLRGAWSRVAPAATESAPVLPDDRHEDDVARR